MYWLLARGQPILISRLNSEVLILATVVVFGLICAAVVIIEAGHGQNSWQMWLKGTGIGLADLLVVVVIFALLRQTDRSPWWACFWVFSISPFAEMVFPLWLPATALLLLAFLAYASRLRRWAGVCLALATLACPFVAPVAVVAGAGVWQERKRGRIANKDALLVSISFAGVVLTAAALALLWPTAFYPWDQLLGRGIGYARWSTVRLLRYSPRLMDMYRFEAAAWLIGMATVAIAAIRCKWSAARTAMHWCVLCLIFSPLYFYLFLLPILALGPLVWNRCAFWLVTICALLVQGRSRSYLAHHSHVVWAEWLLWTMALVLEVNQLAVDMAARPAQRA